MNKTTLLIVGGVVALGALWYVFGMSNSTGTDTPTMADRMQERMSMKHSLREFITMGESLKCSYTDERDGVKTEGTTYVSGGKVRSDSNITTLADGRTMNSSSIIDGDYLYAWGTAMPHGMKMKLAAIEDVKENAAQGADTMGMDMHASAMDTAYEHECEPWTPDQSFFALPAGIEFTDYSEMMKNMQGMMQSGMMMQGGTDTGMVDGEMMMDHSNMGGMTGASGMPSKDMLCAACEQAPDEVSRTQCRVQVGCE